ncbi:MAG: ankyrin repeat domain-containing protein [Parachlamydiales bacterium]|jgi:ankyrin repeat protein
MPASDALPANPSIGGLNSPFKWEKAAMLCDALPIISTVYNIVTLVQKLFLAFYSKETLQVKNHHYWVHLKRKSFLNCIILTIPLLGTLITSIIDVSKYEKIWNNQTTTFEEKINQTIKAGLSLDREWRFNDVYETPLIHAINENNIEAVKLLLKEGANPNIRDNRSGTVPLLQAIERENLEMVRVLLETGQVNVNVIGSDIYFSSKRTPLQAAILKKNLDIVKLLLKNGADVNIPNSHDYTPLHLAILLKNPEMVRVLLETGRVDVNVIDCTGTPLHNAILSENLAIVKLLLKNGADVNFSGSDITPLNSAIYMKNLPIVNALLKTGKVNFNLGQPPEAAAAVSGDLEILQALLQNQVNIQNITKALFSAAYSGHNHIIEELLKIDGVNVNSISNGSTALHLAVQAGKQETVRFLLERGADVNIPNSDPRSYLFRTTPLYLAVLQGNQTIVELLLKNGADVNIPNSHGDTPLHCAAQKGFLEIVQLLLDHGAKINFPNELEKTPLDEALKFGRDHVIALLQQKEATSGLSDAVPVPFLVPGNSNSIN